MWNQQVFMSELHFWVCFVGLIEFACRKWDFVHCWLNPLFGIFMINLQVCGKTSIMLILLFWLDRAFTCFVDVGLPSMFMYAACFVLSLFIRPSVRSSAPLIHPPFIHHHHHPHHTPWMGAACPCRAAPGGCGAPDQCVVAGFRLHVAGHAVREAGYPPVP